MAINRFSIYAFAILACGAAQPASASALLFSGNTSGLFDPTTPADLQFTSASFSGTTSVAGFLALTDLGQFSLAIPDGDDKYDGHTFTLNIDFLSPDGVSGNPVQFAATLSGDVKVGNSGKVDITFSPGTQLFSFSNGSESGSFDLTIDNISGLARGDSATLTGSITNATDPTAAPEPASLLMVLTAGAGLCAKIKRARSRQL